MQHHLLALLGKKNVSYIDLCFWVCVAQDYGIEITITLL